MREELKQFDATVAGLTAPGQPFEIKPVDIEGVSYPCYASVQQTMREYFKIMLAHADKEFAVYQDERYTYGEGYQRSAELAAALVQAYGVKHGDRVAILSRNNPQWMMGFVASLSVGAVAVPMNAWWTTEELDYGFEDSGAKVVIADPDPVPP